MYQPTDLHCSVFRRLAAECGTSRGEDDPNMKDSPKKVRTAADGQHRNTSQPSIRCCLNK